MTWRHSYQHPNTAFLHPPHSHSHSYPQPQSTSSLSSGTNEDKEQPLSSPSLQVAESRAFVPVTVSAASKIAAPSTVKNERKEKMNRGERRGEEQREHSSGSRDERRGEYVSAGDHGVPVKSEKEEEEVVMDDTMESVSVTVTEFSEEEEEEAGRETDVASEDTMFEESLPQEGTHTCTHTRTHAHTHTHARTYARMHTHSHTHTHTHTHTYPHTHTNVHASV